MSALGSAPASDPLGDGHGDPGEAPVRVLYFTGSGRSGTTVINNILGQLPGAFACGELRYLWRRGVVEDHLCACGETFAECPVWSAVMASPGRPGSVAGEPISADEAAGVAARLLNRLASRRVPAMLARRVVGRTPVPPHPDDATVHWLYRSVARHTGGALVVDSSKLPPYGLLLHQLPGVEVLHLHVVRDSRATAFSWQRTKPTLDHAGGDQVMPKLMFWKSSLLWAWWNTLTVALWGRSPGYLRVRYEDFVADPRGVMQTIAEWAGLPADDLPFETPTSVRMAPTHSVAGNPSRHSRGAVEIRSDDEWTRAMPTRDRRLVTAMTAAVLLGFGYSLRAGAVAAVRGGGSSTRERLSGKGVR
ncbi:sulfotransferase [Terracoccus luteus]|uniref:sulfotransferase n=1 Tax=Terracoccus luteus TaxID=53356 RepID=UPI001476069A|nr:sulfotransferase [Terracoccus luteus]